MKKSFIALFCSFIFLLVFASCATTKNASSKTGAEKKSSASNVKKIAYKITTVRDNDNAVSSEYRYPQFTGFDSLNARIRKEREEAYVISVNDIKKDWADFDKEQKSLGSKEATPPFDYKVNCSPVIAGPEYISMLFTTYTYTGGNHGEYTLESITYDVNAEKDVSITEVSGYTINEIAQYCHDYLVKNLRYGNGSKESEDDRIAWIAEGTIPNEANYQTFTFDGKTLTVYFEHYRVAPYASGIQAVSMTVKK
ncbi:MAG: DUF4163 domain-containing protein [Treponema sp.]|nr:DUF4163 domain-containing protein [Treponema sp.]